MAANYSCFNCIMRSSQLWYIFMQLYWKWKSVYFFFYIFFSYYYCV